MLGLSGTLKILPLQAFAQNFTCLGQCLQCTKSFWADSHDGHCRDSIKTIGLLLIYKYLFEAALRYQHLVLPFLLFFKIHTLKFVSVSNWHEIHNTFMETYKHISCAKAIHLIALKPQMHKSSHPIHLVSISTHAISTIYLQVHRTSRATQRNEHCD